MTKKSNSAKVWIVVIASVIIGGFWIGNMNDSNNDSNNVNEVENEPQGGSFLELTEGLNMKVLTQGSGSPINIGDTAVVHYTGTLDDGTVFDSSIPRGQRFEFIVGAGQVIQGWDLGVAGMKVGEKRLLVIAPELAYGPTARGSIPANSTLTFEVELFEIR